MSSTSDTNPPPSSPPEHPVTAGELRHVVKIHDVRVLVGIILSIVGGTVAAWMLLQNEARAQAHVVTGEVVRRLDNVERVLKEHMEDSREVHIEVRDALRAVQTDTRDLYKTITTGRPSPRLERPIEEK